MKNEKTFDERYWDSMRMLAAHKEMDCDKFMEWRAEEISKQEGKWKSRHPESLWTKEQWEKSKAEFSAWYREKHGKNPLPEVSWRDVREFFLARFGDSAAAVDEYFGYSKREEVPF